MANILSAAQLRQNKFSTQQLQTYLENVPLSLEKEVDLRRVRLSEASPELLGLSVGHLHKINLSSTKLSTEHGLVVLEACVSSPALLDVDLGFNNLENIPSENLSRAASHLRRMNLFQTHLTTEQIISVLEACISSPTLEDVDLGSNILEEISSNLLAQAASHLQTINLGSTHLSTEQSMAVLEACKSSAKLIDVNLSSNSLEEVPPEQLSQAVGQLQKMSLFETRLTTKQILDVLETCTSSPRMVDINLGCIRMEGISPELLQRAASQLRTIGLSTASLTPDQCRAVLKACISSPILKDVDLGFNYNCWEEIPHELLRQAVGQLRSIDLAYADLTIEQSTAIFEACISSSTMKDVNLDGNDLYEVPDEALAEDNDDGFDLIEVPKEKLAEAVKHLDRIVLSDSPGILYSQLNTVLEASIASNTEVFMIFYRLFEEDCVSSELLSEAKRRGLFSYEQT